MNRRTPLLLVGTTLGFWASSAGGLVPPHDQSNGIGCKDCHALHANPPLVRDATQEAVCKSCHNPTGMAASLSKVAMHVVAGGSRTVDCGSCHNLHERMVTTDPHPGGATAANLKLVRGDIAKYLPGALAPAVFQQRPQHFAFGDGNAPFDGICQSCHSQTAHHRKDGTSDHAHGMGAVCTQCHTHESGFKATSCTSCHSVPQDNGDGVPVGGRRPVALEFPTGSMHGHFKSGSVQDSDCLVCHSVQRHQSGNVDLIDPDTGTLLSFVTPADLTHDPDLSNFCANCHDASGAARLATPLDPFGNGNRPPDIKSRFQGTLQWREWYGPAGWFSPEGTYRPVNSHHDLSDADQALSGAKIECTSCHGSHNSASTQKVADPDATQNPWPGTTTQFCLRCHGGGSGPTDPGMPAGVKAPMIEVGSNHWACDSPYGNCPDGGTLVSGLRPLSSCGYTGVPWYVDYTWANSAHGPSSKRGWTGYSGAPSANLDCTVCHDPHGSWTESNPAGNPYLIRDLVDGTPFTDDGMRPSLAPDGGWLGPPWETKGTKVPVVVPVSGQPDWGGLCGACHSLWERADLVHSNPTHGCQLCHGHGQAWGEYDWGGGGNDQPCP
jgi:hypothetical protein